MDTSSLLQKHIPACRSEFYLAWAWHSSACYAPTAAYQTGRDKEREDKDTAVVKDCYDNYLEEVENYSRVSQDDVVTAPKLPQDGINDNSEEEEDDRVPTRNYKYVLTIFDYVYYMHP